MSQETPPLLNACPNCSAHLDVSDFEPYSKVICPHCEETIRVRHQFHHFVIKEEIGIGGMSRVFRALDSALNRDVALKILNRQCSADEKRVEQFEREARITASISHPNVVKVFSSGWDQGYFYIAMELVRGGTLDQKIREMRRLPESQLLGISQQLTRGFKAAHDVGLIHRDIKPGNILFASDGTPKIVDFGLALMVQEKDTETEIWATPFYVPPEKLFGEPEDHRSDIYSLGATLFHAAYGRPPYEKDTNSMDELRSLKSQPVMIKKEEQNFVSKSFSEILLSCLQRRAEDRPQDYKSLFKHFEFAAVNKAGLPSSASKQKKFFANRRVLGSAAGLVAAASAYCILKPTAPADREHNGPRLVIGGDPMENRDQNLSQQYNSARQMLLKGQYAEAEVAFKNASENAPQPTKNWCQLHRAICLWLQGKTEAAGQYILSMTPQGEGEVGQFFSDARQFLSNASLADSLAAKAFPKDGFQAMAYLGHGAHAWSKAEPAQAAQLWDTLLSGNAEKQGWVSIYREWLTRLSEQAKMLASFTSLSPDSPELVRKAKEAYTSIAKLPDSPSKDKVLQILESLKPQIAAAVSAAEATAATQEHAAIDELLAKQADPKNRLDFKKGATSLVEIPIETVAGKNRQTALKESFAAAQKLFASLQSELPQISSPLNLEQIDGKVLSGKVVKVDSLQVVLNTATGEQSCPWANLQPKGILKLGETLLEQPKAMDTAEYYSLRQQIVHLAICTGQKYTAQVKAAELTREFPEFRAKWAYLTRN